MQWYRMQPPALRALLTINVVLYVLWVLILVHIRGTSSFVLNYLALHNPSLSTLFFEPWQLITYNFLHLSLGFWGLLHILFNMLWLVWIGREFEQLHGSHRLLAVYLIAGIGGGILTLVWFTLFTSSVDVLVYGASASVLGVITTVAIFYPHKSIALFLIPFPIRLIHLVIAFLVLDLLLIAGSTSAIAAHAGGALFGFLFAKGERAGLDLSSWTSVFFSRSGRGRRPSAPRASSSTPARTSLFRRAGRKRGTASARVTPMPKREEERPVRSPDAEIDRILDKISEQGYEALTSEEKRMLYEASKK